MGDSGGSLSLLGSLVSLASRASLVSPVSLVSLVSLVSFITDSTAAESMKAAAESMSRVSAACIDCWLSEECAEGACWVDLDSAAAE